MTRWASLLYAVLLLITPAPGEDHEAAQLRMSFESAVAALNAGDIDGFLADVHEKALSFYSCGPTSGKEGKAACQLDWERFFGKTHAARFEPQNMQYRVIGNTGIAWGEYEVNVKTRDGGNARHRGRYTMTYTKEDGKWKVIMQHNTPAEQGPAGPRERLSRARPSGS